MYNMQSYNIATKSVDSIVLFSSAMMRKLESMGYAEDGIVKVVSALEMELSDNDRAIAQAHLQHIVATGLDISGNHYVPFFAGSSDIRKGASGWIRQELQAEIGQWAMCGLKTRDLNIAVNKYAAYIGLLMSSTRSFMQVYGRELDVRRVCVVKDSFVTVSGKADFVRGNSVTTDVDHSVEINAFDGAAYILPHITGGKASTLRAPWVKAMAIPLDYIRFAEERGLSTVIKDYWGNDVDLRDIDMVLTESCFKMASQYQSFAQYQAAFEQLGHEICVCVEEHAPRKKAMPYQQLQTLVGGTYEDAMKLAYMTKEVMDKYHAPDEAAGLVGGYLAKAARLYHGLLVEPFTARTMNEAYEAKRNKAIGGKVLDLGYNAFLAPDPIAMLEALFGLPIRGSLKAGECFCANGGTGWVDVTRSPHLDHAHVILRNVKKPNDFFVGPTMYLNICDFTTIRLRADYDGDHVWYSRNAFLLNAVRKTDRLIGNLPVDWIAPKAPKTAINRSTLAQFFTGLTQTSQIGIYADNFTKFWSWVNEELDKGSLSMEEAREVWCWLTYAGNVLIDAAKHGSANVRPPEMVRKFSKMPLPAFCEYAKADSIHPVGDEHWDAKTAKTNGFGDMYSRCVQNNIDEHLCIDNVEDLVFDVNELMIDPERKIGCLNGLYVRGRWNSEAQQAEGEGLFQQLAFATARELEALGNGNNDQHHVKSWEAERGLIAFMQIKQWAEDHGSTIEHAYDVIVRCVFAGGRNESETYKYTMKRAFWSFFGAFVVQVLKNRQDVFSTDLDELPDDDYDELKEIEE